MFTLDVIRRASVTAAAALFAGCSSAGTPPGGLAPGAEPFVAHARPATQYDGSVFVSDLVNGTVWICPANFHDIRNGFTFPTGQLSGVSNPVQIAVDRDGTVYVANSQTDASGAGSVTIYPRGRTAPARTLTAGLNTSLGVAVDSAGTVYVSNKLLGSIEKFAKGESVPSATITANLKGPDGLAVNRAGDLFIADSAANDVLMLVHGTKTPKSLGLGDITRPTGIAVDALGNLYVANLLGASSSIAVYPPHATKPSRKFAVRGPYSLVDQPLMLSIAPGDMLIVSAFSSLRRIQGVWSAYGAVASGYAAGESRPMWREFNQSFNYGEFVTYDDAVFVPAR
jgi:DNA-binding beta-propeller fold protein YncE